METQNNRAALDQHWAASAAGDLEAEHRIYDDRVVCEYPQSSEKILGRHNLQALRGHHPGKPSGFLIRRITGMNDLWITEYVIKYETTVVQTVSIMEFQNGRVVHETQYFAEPFEAPTWRIAMGGEGGIEVISKLARRGGSQRRPSVVGVRIATGGVNALMVTLANGCSEIPKRPTKSCGRMLCIRVNESRRLAAAWQVHAESNRKPQNS